MGVAREESVAWLVVRGEGAFDRRLAFLRWDLDNLGSSVSAEGFFSSSSIKERDGL